MKLNAFLKEEKKRESHLVVTRFAPSPTGLLHLGGARTALFNFLFAKHFQGKFLIRFEDTDQKRNLQTTKKQILEKLTWLGIEADVTITNPDQNGPYSQSERLAIYQKMAQKLLQAKKAYYCFCSKERLEKIRKLQLAKKIKAPRYDLNCWKLSPQAIESKLQKGLPKCYRLHVLPQQVLTFSDLVYQEMKFNTDHIEDFVIIKTDGYPTYNFAVTVDDLLMKVSHVLRGSDHLSNTAKQILLYQTFNSPLPQFGHLSLIQMKAAQKISKRNADPHQYVSYYQAKGYLPTAIFNYLALLGWTPDKFQELYFQPAELIAKFDGQNLNKAQSTFSLVKLDWINHKHIANLSAEVYWQHAQKYCQELIKKDKLSLSRLKMMALLFQGEINYFAQLPTLITTHFLQPPTRQEELITFLAQNEVIITKLENKLPPLPWEEEKIGEMLAAIGKEVKLKGKKLLKPIRIVATGRESGPQLVKMLFLLGKEKVVTNIKQYWKWKANNQN